MRTNKRVSAIIIKNADVLLIHRRKAGNEYWVVPGGGVEDGETVEQGLNREVREETSLNIIKFSLLATNKEKLAFDDGEKEIEHFFYICDLAEGEPILGGTEAETNSENNWYHLEWVNVDSFQGLDLYPNYIKQLVEKIKSKIK